MTPLVRFLKRRVEKAFGRWYEGPEAPKRLRSMVEAFAATNPNATRGEWLEFAAKHAAEAYRSGYTRGLEWSERDKDRGVEAIDPDQIAEEQAHGFEWQAIPSSLDLQLAEKPPEGPMMFRSHEEAATYLALQETESHEPRNRGPRRK